MTRGLLITGILLLMVGTAIGQNLKNMVIANVSVPGIISLTPRYDDPNEGIWDRNVTIVPPSTKAPYWTISYEHIYKANSTTDAKVTPLTVITTEPVSITYQGKEYQER